MPQPVSRVSSLSRAPRTALAMREPMLLANVALRPTRWPATSPTSASLKRARNSGIGFGSFWPSPSSVTMIGPRAASAPDHSAALWPSERAWTTRLTGSPRPASRSSVAAVSSLLPSSTTTTSNGRAPTAAAISGMSSLRLSASLRAGITTESDGWLLSGIKSQFPCERRALSPNHDSALASLRCACLRRPPPRPKRPLPSTSRPPAGQTFHAATAEGRRRKGTARRRRVAGKISGTAAAGILAGRRGRGFRPAGPEPERGEERPDESRALRSLR